MTDKEHIRNEIAPLPCKSCERDVPGKVCSAYRNCPAWRVWFAREFARVTQALRRRDDGIGEK